jgi:hypothetical protein
MCLFVKHDTVHYETVSELFSFLFFPLIRRIVPEIDLHVEIAHEYGSHSFGTVVAVWCREMSRTE